MAEITLSRSLTSFFNGQWTPCPTILGTWVDNYVEVQDTDRLPNFSAIGAALELIQLEGKSGALERVDGRSFLDVLAKQLSDCVLAVILLERYFVTRAQRT